MSRRAIARVLALATALVAARAPAEAAPARHPRAAATTATAPAAAAKHATRGHAAPHPAPAPLAPPRARVSIGGAPVRDAAPQSDAWRRQKDSELSLEERTAKRLEELLRAGPLRVGTTALYVVDASTGAELFAVHPDDPLNPASNVKLISTAAALDTLGADYRYRTRVLGPSPDHDGAVHGDLYLLGSYDPTLDPAGVRDLAASIAAAGIKRIDGGVVVGDADRDGMLRAKVQVSVSATTAGRPPTVSIEPLTSFVVVSNDAVTGKSRRSALKVSDGSSTAPGGGARFEVHVTGTLGRGKSATYTLYPDQRAQLTAELLRAALIKAGVTVTGPVRVTDLSTYATRAATEGWLPVELAAHSSDPLAAIVAQVNKRSINWLADRVIMTAAATKYGATPSMPGALDAMYAWLDAHAHLERADVLVDTGSGLSHKTAFSARQIVEVLRAAAGPGDASATDDAHARACRAAYLDSLSVAGVDGTLRGRFRGALRGKLHAKTGTLRQAVALSGFLDVAPGHTLAFSLVTNGNAPGSHREVRAAHERLVGVLAEYAAALAGKDGKDGAKSTAAAPLAPPPTTTTTTTTTAPAATPLPADDEGEEGADDVPAAPAPPPAP